MEIIPPDTFVASFLRAAEERGLSTIVSYGFNDPEQAGKPVLRVKSNVNPKATAAMLNWLNRTDERAAEAAGRGLHDDSEGACVLCQKEISWHALKPDEQERHFDAARLVLRSATASSHARVLS